MLLPFPLLALLAGPPPTSPVDTEVQVSVTVDSSRHEIRIKAGPFRLPDMGQMMDHAEMDMGAAHSTPVYRFPWPVEGWFRGFRTGVEDAGGRPLPKRLMHHMIVVNFSRRQAIYRAAERLFGAGQETSDATLPPTIGVPMASGMDLGFYIAWHNDTGADLDGVYLVVTMLYSPSNQNPRPIDVLPLYMDVNLTVGGSNVYDLPPGRSERSYAFTLPVGGRILGYGGHLHDYGRVVRLEDVGSRRTLARVTARRDSAGHVQDVSRSLPGVRGAGIRLKAGHAYRVVGVYDNPTGRMLRNGAMAHIAAVFAPDDLARWPGIDESDPEYQRDLASLEVLGVGSGEDHEHGGSEHHHPTP